MTSPDRPLPWRATSAHLRAVVAGVALALVAVVLRRPDLLVLATPLLVISLWSVLNRPVRPPTLTAGLGHRTLREGQATTWRATLSMVDGLEEAAVLLDRPRWSELQPSGGAQSGTAAPGSTDPVILSLGCRTLRWGTRPVGPAVVAASSAWGAFRWGPSHVPSMDLTTLPTPAVFDAAAPAPHPVGLVGRNRSARPGDGSEFASIRPFQPGDRLRRIHWPVSTRTGELHVTSTYADQDAQVILVVDGAHDLGASEGLGSRSSSLDVTVRAAAAVAEHYLHQGERVGMRAFGSASLNRVPTAAGRTHLRRILDVLAGIEPGTERRVDTGLTPFGLSAGSLVIMLSPLVSPAALGHAVALTRRGLTVVVIDTLPPDVSMTDEHDPLVDLAWRVRCLERDREVRRVLQAGVPVVAWKGPGSLDEVLRDLGRRAAAPRMTHR